MKRISKILTVMLAISFLCALSGQLVAEECKNWSAGLPVDGGEISVPPDDATYLAGAEVSFSCTDPTDPDSYTTSGPPCNSGCTENDSLSTNYPRWTASSSSFPVTYIGNIVDWQSPDGEVSDITVEVYDDDLPLALGPCDCGSRDDTQELQDTHTINTVTPEVITVNFQPASAAYNLKTHVEDDTVSSTTVAEYERDYEAEDPHTVHAAAFKKNTKLKAKVTVEHEDDLTDFVTVDVCGYVSSVLGDICEVSGGGQTFGAAWTSTTGTLESDENLDNSIEYYDDVTLEWGYLVPSGSNTWISMTVTEHPVCVTDDAPSNGPHYEWVARASCKAADGEDSGEAKEIVDSIYDDLEGCARVDDWDTKLNYMIPDSVTSVDSLLDNTQGLCGDFKKYFVALCNVQGVDSTDGLKAGKFAFNEDTRDEGSNPKNKWIIFRVAHAGINNNSGDGPHDTININLVDDDEYPYPSPGEISSVEVTIWDYTPLVFGDHSVVFLDGDTDYLYDPSFPLASPAEVTWPGSSGIKEFTGTSNFMTNYFNTSCPYLYGAIQTLDPVATPSVHIHTNDFSLPESNDPYNPDTIYFYWTSF